MIYQVKKQHDLFCIFNCVFFCWSYILFIILRHFKSLLWIVGAKSIKVHWMKSVFNKRREFFRFILVGVLATATHYAIYYFLCVLMLPAIAYTIGYAISFILNFYLSNVFTFNTKPTVRKGIGFGISHLINYLLHIGLLSLFIWTGVPDRWAPLPVFALVVPVNFLLVRFVLKSKKI